MQNKEIYKRENPIVSFFKKTYGALIALAVLLLILSITTTTFMKVDNLLTVLRQICVNGLIAAGLTCVLIVGCIDLSVGSTVAAMGVLCVVLNTTLGVNVYLSIILSCIGGAFIGSINGFLRAKTLLPPFIITLAMQQTVRGLAYIFTSGYPVTSKDTIFNGLGNGNFLGIPKPAYVLLVMLVIVGVILGRTKLGRHMYAVGGNMEAAKHSGISYTSTVTAAYTICGFMAGLAGVIMAARMYSGQPTIGADYATDAIAAAVIGGTAFGGGYGTIPGTFIGAIIIGVMNSGMTHLKIDSYWQMVVKGCLILGAVYFDSVKDKVFKQDKKAKTAAIAAEAAAAKKEDK